MSDNKFIGIVVGAAALFLVVVVSIVLLTKPPSNTPPQTSLALHRTVTPLATMAEQDEVPLMSGEPRVADAKTLLASTAPTGVATDEGRGRDEQRVEEHNRQVEELSQQLLDQLQQIYVTLVTAKYQTFSTNQFIRQENERIVSDIQGKFDDLLTQDFPVHGWILFASKVSTNETGSATIECLIKSVRISETTGAMMLGVFTVRNHECLDKVRTLSTPALIYVYGRYTGKRHSTKVSEEAGFYTLEFDLDDVKPFISDELMKAVKQRKAD